MKIRRVILKIVSITFLWNLKKCLYTRLKLVKEDCFCTKAFIKYDDIGVFCHLFFMLDIFSFKIIHQNLVYLYLIPCLNKSSSLSEIE